LLHFQPPSTSSDASEGKDTISLEEAPSGVDQGHRVFPPTIYQMLAARKEPPEGEGPASRLSQNLVRRGVKDSWLVSIAMYF
jgi:hypothetical protein